LVSELGSYAVYSHTSQINYLQCNKIDIKVMDESAPFEEDNAWIKKEIEPVPNFSKVRPIVELSCSSVALEGGEDNAIDNSPSIEKPMICNESSSFDEQKLNNYLKDKYKLELLTMEERILNHERLGNRTDYLEAHWKCETCFLPFAHEFSLKNHMKKHDEVRIESYNVVISYMYVLIISGSRQYNLSDLFDAI
jgi:hypothetical protein